MKHIIILGDGMADEPISSLNGKTPLQYAKTPAMDFLAKNGCSGTLTTVPDGFHPGSEIANLSVLGYDVSKVFEGRGSLEAASMGIDIKPGEMAMRCNLICVQDGKIKNHSAGHISTEEASELIDFLQSELGSETVHFYPGISYRHLLTITGGNKNIACTPPHDVPGADFQSVLVKAISDQAAETANLINSLILKSQQLLENHPINIKRKSEGKDPANSIWPWSPGYRPAMEPLTKTYDEVTSGSVISAVDLIRGIGVLSGLKVINVDGATGLYDTNYEGKAQAAINALMAGDDFVFLHVEASDEAGHEGDVDLKIKTIEYLDSRIVAPIIEATAQMDVAIAVLPDHPTPCRLRTHTSLPVPFVMYRKNGISDGVETFDEVSAQNGKFNGLVQDEFINTFLKF